VGNPAAGRPVDQDAIDRAKELLVYLPVGLALYLRDTAPTFLRLFIARGRGILDRPATTREGPGLHVVPDEPPSHPPRDAPPTRDAQPEELGIDGYDDLSASEIVDRLEELPPDQLEVIRAHERRHRSRATVLGKIEQLTRPVSA
jgi:hypothetical protein